MPLKLCFRARVALFVPAALALILFASGREVFAMRTGRTSAAASQPPAAADSGVHVDRQRTGRAAQCGRGGADGAREQPRDPGRTAVAADQHPERLAGAGGVRAGAVLELPRTATARSRRAASSRAAGTSSPTRASARTAACSRTCRGAAALQLLARRRRRSRRSAIDSRYNPQLSSNLTAQYVQPLLRDFKTDNLRQQIETSQQQRGHRRHRPARAGHGHDRRRSASPTSI